MRMQPSPAPAVAPPAMGKARVHIRPFYLARIPTEFHGCSTASRGFISSRLSAQLPAISLVATSIAGHCGLRPRRRVCPPKQGRLLRGRCTSPRSWPQECAKCPPVIPARQMSLTLVGRNSKQACASPVRPSAPSHVRAVRADLQMQPSRRRAYALCARSMVLRTPSPSICFLLIAQIDITATSRTRSLRPWRSV